MRNLAGLLVVLLLCGCASADFSRNRVHERSEQVLPAEGVTTLQLQSAAGTVRVEGWDKPQIRLDVVKNAPNSDALKSLQVVVRQSNGAVDIATRYGSGFGISRGDVDYVLMVPHALNLHIENTAGTIDLAGLTGSVSASAKAGTIDAVMAKADANQSIDLAATTGTVTLRIPKKSNATVTARSTIGTVESDFAGISGQSEHVVGSSGAGKIGNGAATINLTTTTGTIELRST